MNYTELVTAINDTLENTFTTANVNNFITMAEKKIYLAIQFPALRKTSTTAMASSTRTYAMPSDFLYVNSFAVNNGSNVYSYLVVKDIDFLREAYPTSTYTGLPKYYALQVASASTTTAILGPTPDANYAVELTYGYYPQTIVTATNTWLGDNFDSVLLNGALVEAARFLKEEEDVIKHYRDLYMESLTIAKTLGDGKLRTDTYRSGQATVKVT